MSWNINDRFRISGTVDLGTHNPRVHTTGTILQLLGSKKAKAMLDDIDGEKDVEATIKLRDIKPIIEKGRR